MLNQPISSPMMNTMFGFLPEAGCFGVAGLRYWTSRIGDLASAAQQAGADSPPWAIAIIAVSAGWFATALDTVGAVLAGPVGSEPPQAARYPKQPPQASNASV